MCAMIADIFTWQPAICWDNSLYLHMNLRTNQYLHLV